MGERLARLSVSTATKTFLILAVIFLLALFLRGYYGYEPATRYGAPYLYSGGSDSFYHQRAVEYALDHHRYLDHDPLLNYPIGFPNPRAPLFDSSIAVWGEMLSPLFGGDTFTSASFVMIWITALFGALTVVPTYLLGREAFSRRIGLMAAFLLAIMPAHIERSVITNADHDSMALFFIVLSFYFFLKGLKCMSTERWVRSWSRPTDITGGISRALRSNRVSLLYGVMSGISLGAVALIWQGYPYAIVTILGYYLITILIDKFRKIDSLSVSLFTGTALLTAFLVAYPYYVLMNRYGQWYDTPFLMFFVAMCVGFTFAATRDLPWMFVLPAGVFAGALILGVLFIISPTFQSSLLTGQGYFFVQSKLYSTIAEAQPAQISRMAMSFGAATFLLGLWGMVHLVYESRKKISHDMVFIVSFAVVGTVLTLSQGRFLFNGAPVISILSAYVIWKVLRIVKFEMIPRAYETARGTRGSALFRSIKIRHVVGALCLVFLILLPNIWFAMDAAIPNEEKRRYDLQVYNSMPGDVDLYFTKLSFHPENYDPVNGSMWYFGAFGYSLPVPEHYWSNAYGWLSRQDTDTYHQEERPAFTSWWDYGFEAINRGRHPSVADNFQNGYQLAGSFLMAQNESEAISFWTARLLEGAYIKNSRSLPGDIAGILERYRVSPERIEDILRSPQAYVKVVLASPERYGNHSDDLSPFNAKYAAIVYELTRRPVDDVASLYRDIRSATGWDVKYFAVDSRLFPFSGRNTGIFYAPAKLADKRMRGSDRTLPYDYFMIRAVTEFGQEYDADEVPPGVRLNPSNPYKIIYKPMFYNTMLYRAFVGYGPDHIHKPDKDGIPGLQGSGSLGSEKPLQAWNLSHFRVAYKTAYWNPYSPENVSSHRDAWRAISWEEGQRFKKENNGTLLEQPDTQVYGSNGGVVILRYYDGAIVHGKVRTTDGRGLPGVRVTVTDEMGVPHDSVLTDANGGFRLIAPFGNLTLTASTGGKVDYMKYVENVELGKATLNVSLAQADRLPYDTDGDGRPDYDIPLDITVNEASVHGTFALDSDRVGGLTSNDTRVGSVDVHLRSTTGNEYTVRTNAGGEYLFDRVAPGTYTITASVRGRTFTEPDFVELKPGDDTEKDWVLKVALVNGTVTPPPPAGDRMMLYSENETLYSNISDSGMFEFIDVFPGVYTLKLDSRTHTVGVERFRANASDLKNFTLHAVEGSRVSLTMKVPTTSGYAPASSAPVIIENMVDGSRVLLHSDGNGVLSTVLPEGWYSFSSTYYHGDGVFGFVRGRPIFDRFEDEVVLTPQVRVWGNVTLPDGSGAATPRVFFHHDGGYLSALGGSQGEYVAYLPRGDYVARVHDNRVTEHYTTVKAFTLSSPRRVDLKMENATRISGVVYSDQDENGAATPGEEVPFVKVESGSGLLRFPVYSSSNGSFNVTVSRGSDQNLVFSRPGMETATEVFSMSDIRSSPNIERNVSVRYTPVEVSGGVYYAGQPVEGDILITFTREIGNTTTAVNTTASAGSYRVTLVPGVYNVTAGAVINPRARYDHMSTMRLSISSEVHNITLSKLINLSFDPGVTGNVTLILRSESHSYNITGPGRLSIEVESGEYNLTATGGDLIYLTRTFINETHASLSGTLRRGVTVSGAARSEGKGKSGMPIHVREESSGWSPGVLTTSAGGAYSIMLVPDLEYSFTINHTVNESLGESQVPVEYSFSGVVRPPSTDIYTYDLEMRSRVVNARLEGTVRDIFGSLLPGLDVSVSGDILQRRLVTDAEGRFQTDLPPGSYTIYAAAVTHGIPQAYMKRITVAYGSGARIDPATLGYAARVSGSVRMHEKPVAANVSITGGDMARVESAVQGRYAFTVPVGTYTLQASLEGEEFGMNVRYTATRWVNATSDVSADLDLEKEKVYSVRLEWDESQMQSLDPGESLASPYTITVHNTGNEPDTYTFSGSPGEWNFTFSPTRLSLDPGNGISTGTVLVRFDAPGDARVEHPALIITADSGSSAITSTVEVKAAVTQHHGVALSKVSAVFNQSNASIVVRVKNTGNGDDNYTLGVMNSAELGRMGWEVRFLGEDGNETDSLHQPVKISEGSKDVTLVARPTAGNPTTFVPVSISASSVYGDAGAVLTFELSLPDAAPGEIYVSGVNVAMEPQNLMRPWVPVIAAVPLAGAALMFTYFVARHGFRGLAIAIRRAFRPRRR